jgi:regulator of protease activity HflC (stomatin/prohibitin superfamily)
MSSSQATVTAIKRIAFSGILVIGLLIAACASFETVETGHVAVGTRFGKVTGQTIDAGFHVVNPLNDWDHFSTLEKSWLFEQITVPAADQQKATMDVSIQFKILPGAAMTLRRDAGVEKEALAVVFTPIVRGALRDAGRNTTRVEEFYSDQTISAYREAALSIIQAQVETKGLMVTDVIVRDVDLPQVIKQAIEAKKKREQEVEQEKATLNKVALEAQRKVKAAEANLTAAALDAKARMKLADGKAYEIDRIQKQLSKAPIYVEYVKAKRWDGVLPRFTGGGAVPFINIKE